MLDQSLRYTVDKTTREILFLPLPSDIKLKAKSFVDVTVDRAAKAAGALLLLVLVKPWGLNLDWQRLSYASLVMTVLWVFMALRAQTRLPQRVPPEHRARDVQASRGAAQRRRSRRPSKRWCRSWRTPTRRGSSTPSTCSSRSTSATW